MRREIHIARYRTTKTLICRQNERLHRIIQMTKRKEKLNFQTELCRKCVSLISETYDITGCKPLIQTTECGRAKFNQRFVNLWLSLIAKGSKKRVPF